MNGLSVSRRKAAQNLQIEVEFKLEIKNCQLQFLSLSARHDQAFPESSKPESFHSMC